MTETNQIQQERKIIESFPFTDNDLFKLSEDERPSALWKMAFDYYNKNSGKIYISMGCKPCYAKVLIYLMKERISKFNDCHQKI